ncbi:hypothetical protein J6590_102449, partial [Homalodisca vitripennis]
HLAAATCCGACGCHTQWGLTMAGIVSSDAGTMAVVSAMIGAAGAAQLSYSLINSSQLLDAIF